MDGMEMYVKFLFTLALGFLGVGVAMTILLETVLNEWDPVLSARRWWRQVSHHRPSAGSVSAEDILSELKGRREGRYEPSSASRPIDRRREVLRDMREADERVASPEPAQAL